MTAQRDSERAAASGGNIDNTVLWVVVDKLGASVKMTFAQFKTYLSSVTSIAGDVTASVASGVATTTIGALKVATGMIQAAAVTYAKIQNVSAANRLLGRYSSGAGVTEEITTSTTYFDTSSAAIKLLPNLIALMTPVRTTSDQSVTSGSLVDVTSLGLTVAANTSYRFEFWVPFIPTSISGGQGIHFSIAVPASVTSVNCEAMWAGYGTATSGVHFMLGERFSTSDGGSGNTTAMNDVTQIHYARVTGVLRNGSNAGAIQLRARVTTGGDTLTLKAGGYGRLTKLG